MATIPDRSLRPWIRGDGFEADHLDEARQGIQRLTQGVSGPVQVHRGRSSAVPSVPQQFKVVRLATDHVVCKKFNGVESEEGEIKIMLPYLLRRTIFDLGLNTDAIERNGLTYVYASDEERTATDTATSETETQVITPSYQEDDVLYAMNRISGGVGFITDAFDQTEQLDWIDLNLDGRVWSDKC